MQSKPLYIVTFDVEDWFHLLEHEQTAHEHQWSQFESRLQQNTELILESLGEAGVKATFFCLGWVGRNHPQVIKSIQAAGHEIGSHSDKHKLVFDLTPAQFKEDLIRSVGSLEDITGQKVRCYRSPGFSVTERSTWALSVLAENGIEWDSSVFASVHSHGGFPTLLLNTPTIIEVNGSQIKQFPVVPGWLMRRPLNFSGGGYFRVMPYALIRKLMTNSQYVMTYFHPRDFDANQPVVPGLSPRRMFKSYVGLRSSMRKFKMLLADFRFVSIGQADSSIDWTTKPKLSLGAANIR